jgi:hypothetical protein
MATVAREDAIMGERGIGGALAHAVKRREKGQHLK